MPVPIATPHRRLRGTTLIELGVVTALIALTAAASLPSYSTYLDRRALDAALAEFDTDVAYVRAQSRARGEGLRLAFGVDGHRHCYVIHTGAPGQCQCATSGQAACSDGAQALRVADLGERVRISANVRTTLFDPRRETVSPALSLTFATRDAGQVRQVINILGRVRRCALSEAVGGLPPC